MKLIDYNLAQDAATDVSYSSQNAYFPASNLKHEFRSKVWRSSGTFVVDTTNNKIDFKDTSAGSELTATIASGTYTPASLITEINTKMAAVGANVYTASQSNSTGKWTIVSDGAEFDLLNGTGTNAATSLLVQSLGFAASDLDGALTYTGSNIAIHTEESVVFDLKTIEDINTVALLWPKEDGIRLSSGAVVTVQANATNVWTAPAVSQVVTINNTYEVATHTFSVVQSYRYWRLVIEDPANANLFIELGVVVLGKGLEIDPPANGFTWSVADQTRIQRTAYGNEYSDLYPLTTSLDFAYEYMEYADVVTIENSFRTNGSSKPVFVMLDETEIVFGKDHFTIYGKYSKSFDPKHIFRDNFETQISIREIF